MTWDDFLNKSAVSEYNGQVQTDIVCPECGRKIYLDKTIILTPYPNKYYYWCSCGWNGYSPMMWTKGDAE